METVVVCNGTYYLMSSQNLEVMLKNYAGGDIIHLPDYGKRVSTFDFSNISRQAAGEYLDQTKGEVSG